MIDNYDSFTYNLVQYLAELGEDVHVARNDALSIAEIVKLSPQRIVISPGPGTPNQTAALTRLADLGAATWQVDGDVSWAGKMTVAEAVQASEAITEREAEIERTRLAMMRHYSDHAGCRRSFLLTYFGQDYPGPCGNCDNDALAPAEPVRAVPFPVGARVVSERWGQGTVQRYDGDQITVLFDEHGYRELFVPVVLDRGLLRPA